MVIMMVTMVMEQAIAEQTMVSQYNIETILFCGKYISYPRFSTDCMMYSAQCNSWSLANF